MNNDQLTDFNWVLLAGHLNQITEGFNIYKELSPGGDYRWRWEYRENCESVSPTLQSKLFDDFPECLKDFIRCQILTLPDTATRISEQIPGLNIWREVGKGWKWLYEDGESNEPLHISIYYDTFAEAMAAFINWKAEE